MMRRAALSAVMVALMMPTAAADDGPTINGSGSCSEGQCDVSITVQGPASVPIPLPGAPTPDVPHAQGPRTGTNRATNGQPSTATSQLPGSSSNATSLSPAIGAANSGACIGAVCPAQASNTASAAPRTATPGPQPARVPTAAEWKAAVAAQMKPSAPAIGSAPCHEAGCMGAVGVPVWQWVTNNTGDITKSITLAGQSITARAHLTGVTWDHGDGTDQECTSMTAYDTRKGWAKSPDCGYVYTKRGRYTLSATAHWSVTWTGAALGSDTITTRASVPVAIGEYQALTQ